MSHDHPYSGLPVALTTKHGKQSALAPALAERPGLRIVIPEGVDTDQLGTFSGEIARPAPPRDTVIMKARWGMHASGLPRGLASEGAFGPHPEIGFIPVGLELLAFLDDEQDLEIVVEQSSVSTNFAHTTTRALDSPTMHFLTAAHFGSHAMIVRPNTGPTDGPLFKGIRTNSHLETAIARCSRASDDEFARLETDMRAHLNPTRMQEIAKLAAVLADRLSQVCDECAAPGFGLLTTEPGLPCAFCFTATTANLAEIHGCPRCEYRVRRSCIELADPACCPTCNP